MLLRYSPFDILQSKVVHAAASGSGCNREFRRVPVER